MSSPLSPTNRYELAFALEKIEGYDVRASRQINRVAEFENAKREAIAAYQRYVWVLEGVTFEQYMAVRKEGKTAERPSVEAAE